MERKKLPKLVSLDFFFFCIGPFLSKVMIWLHEGINQNNLFACMHARVHTHAQHFTLLTLPLTRLQRKHLKTLSCFQLSFWIMQHPGKQPKPVQESSALILQDHGQKSFDSPCLDLWQLGSLKMFLAKLGVDVAGLSSL